VLLGTGGYNPTVFIHDEGAGTAGADIDPEELDISSHGTIKDRREVAG
jgi:hypothetical protein